MKYNLGFREYDSSIRNCNYETLNDKKQQIIKKSQNMRVRYIKVSNYIIALNIFEFNRNHILSFIIQRRNLLRIN
jgi:hypothetical protein